jgi:hypothetical protein
MPPFTTIAAGAAALLSLLIVGPAAATPFTFSTGTVNNLIATASRPGPMSGVNQETESADDFFLPSATRLDTATFTGLIPSGASISEIVVEIYRVFPADSNTARTSFPVPPFSTPQVPARQNSPSDVEFEGRDSAVAGELSFTTTALGAFTSAQNSVDTGIHPIPNFNTGGDGPVTGRQEVQFNVTFTEPIDLPADHYFFVPQVLLSDPNQHFLWLSGRLMSPNPMSAVLSKAKLAGSGTVGVSLPDTASKPVLPAPGPEVFPLIASTIKYAGPSPQKLGSHRTHRWRRQSRANPSQKIAFQRHSGR